MIRLRIREFNLEVIKPKLWETGVLLAPGVFGWIAYAYLLPVSPLYPVLRAAKHSAPTCAHQLAGNAGCFCVSLLWRQLRFSRIKGFCLLPSLPSVLAIPLR